MSKKETDREAIKRLSNQSKEELAMIIICQRDELECQGELIKTIQSELEKYADAQRQEAIRLMDSAGKFFPIS